MKVFLIIISGFQTQPCFIMPLYSSSSMNPKCLYISIVVIHIYIVWLKLRYEAWLSLSPDFNSKQKPKTQTKTRTVSFIWILKKNRKDLSFYQSTLRAHKKCLFNIHSDMLQTAGMTIWTRISENNTGLELISLNNQSVVLSIIQTMEISSSSYKPPPASLFSMYNCVLKMSFTSIIQSDLAAVFNRFSKEKLH